MSSTIGVRPDLGPDAGVDALDWSCFWRVAFSGLDASGPPPAIRCEAIDSDAVVILLPSGVRRRPFIL